MLWVFVFCSFGSKQKLWSNFGSLNAFWWQSSWLECHYTQVSSFSLSGLAKDHKKAKSSWNETLTVFIFVVTDSRDIANLIVLLTAVVKWSFLVVWGVDNRWGGKEVNTVTTQRNLQWRRGIVSGILDLVFYRVWIGVNWSFWKLSKTVCCGSNLCASVSKINKKSILGLQLWKTSE